MTVPGLGVPGVFAIGQFDDDSVLVAGHTLESTLSIAAGTATGVATSDALAPGAVLELSTHVIAGVASSEQLPRRFAGGAAFVRPRHRGAPGAVLELNASLIPGTVEVGHEVTLTNVDGTSRTITLHGFTDDELCSNDLMTAILMQDEVTWIEFSHNSQQVRMAKGEPLIKSLTINAREIRITLANSSEGGRIGQTTSPQTQRVTEFNLERTKRYGSNCN